MSGREQTGSIIFLVLVVSLLVGFAYYQEQLSPTNQTANGDKVTVSQFSLVGIESIGFSSTKLRIQFRIDNPTPISTTLENASYHLYGNGNYLGAGVITQQVKIPARASTTIKTDFVMAFSGSVRVIWSYFLSYRNQISWEAKGNATFAEPVLGIANIQFDCKSSPPQGSISCPSIAAGSPV